MGGRWESMGREDRGGLETAGTESQRDPPDKTRQCDEGA